MLIHGRFAAMAEREPERTALWCAAESVTYRELNARSNRLAQYLGHLGVGPEVRVGICAEPSIDLVVGLLAILKAGASYVPLSPALPGERIALILADAGAPVVRKAWLVPMWTPRACAITRLSCIYIPAHQPHIAGPHFIACTSRVKRLEVMPVPVNMKA